MSESKRKASKKSPDYSPAAMDLLNVAGAAISEQYWRIRRGSFKTVPGRWHPSTAA
jgi:phage-related tail fiber protein